MKIKSLLLITFFAASLNAVAQDDLGNIIQGSVKDAEYLMKGYTAPILKIFGTGLNQGWYNTGKAHKIAGFDLTVTVSPIYFKSQDLVYYVDNTKLSSNIQLVNSSNVPTSGNVPTALGSDDVTPRYRVVENGVTTYVSGPSGLGVKAALKINALPMPMVQFGVGLPKGTDLKLRFFPKTNFGDNNSSANLLGIGVMHDVKQWIPGIKNLPFDLSGFVGFTKLKVDVGIDNSKPDQRGILEANATTIQGIISKKLSVLTVYGALGYNIAKTTVALKGKYDFSNGSITDPLTLSETVNGFRATGGLRLKLAVIAFHADYTIQKYNALTVGFGINIR